MTNKTPIVCNLDAEDTSNRTREWKHLLSQSINYRRIADGVEVIFPATTGLKETAQNLAKKEKDCCAFFNFSFTDLDKGFKLLATAPPEAQFVFEEDGWSKLATKDSLK